MASCLFGIKLLHGPLETKLIKTLNKYKFLFKDNLHMKRSYVKCQPQCVHNQLAITIEYYSFPHAIHIEINIGLMKQRNQFMY